MFASHGCFHACFSFSVAVATIAWRQGLREDGRAQSTFGRTLGAATSTTLRPRRDPIIDRGAGRDPPCRCIPRARNSRLMDASVASRSNGPRPTSCPRPMACPAPPSPLHGRVADDASLRARLGWTVSSTKSRQCEMLHTRELAGIGSSRARMRGRAVSNFRQSLADCVAPSRLALANDIFKSRRV